MADIVSTIDRRQASLQTGNTSAMADGSQLTALTAPSSRAYDDRSSQDSNVSHASRLPRLNLSTSDISPLTFARLATDELTPPSSVASSQDGPPRNGSPSPSRVQANRVGSGQKGEVQGQHPVRDWDSRSPSRTEAQPGTPSGTKRTASGQVKRSSIAGIDDLAAKASSTRHSRSSSVLSNGSSGNVKEVSQQLRTKLQYAMIKVQNGWQSRSLDEIESLASQSPRSTVSGFHHQSDLLSPRGTVSTRYQRKLSDSDSSDSAPPPDREGGHFSPGSSSLERGMAASLNASRRALAPPVDIMPGARRRPTPNGPVYSGDHRAHEPTRQTASTRPGPSQRTPSQNAAMEADAVETLLFMASPNNSGYRPPPSSQESSLRSTQAFSPSQTSPLRAQFSQTSVTSPKKVAFSEHGLMARHDLDKAAFIDQMLDNLSDESDEELEEALRLAERSKATSLST